MPFDNELYIGTLAGGTAGMVKVASLGAGVYASAIQQGAFTVDPIHYADVVLLADGTELEVGWLECAWQIGGLRDEQYAALIAYKTAHTTQLYIRTLDQDGKTYKNFLVNAIFPLQTNRGDPTAVEAGAVFDFSIRFTKAIETP